MNEPREERRIDYVELQVSDMAATKKFYGGLFGWEFVDYGPDYASFNDGRLDGGFAVVDKVSVGAVLLVFYSKDLEALIQQIEEHGGRIVKPTFEFPGGRRFHFADPSGNELAAWSDR